MINNSRHQLPRTGRQAPGIDECLLVQFQRQYVGKIFIQLYLVGILPLLPLQDFHRPIGAFIIDCHKFVQSVYDGFDALVQKVIIVPATEVQNSLKVLHHKNQ